MHLHCMHAGKTVLFCLGLSKRFMAINLNVDLRYVLETISPESKWARQKMADLAVVNVSLDYDYAFMTMPAPSLPAIPATMIQKKCCTNGRWKYGKNIAHINIWNNLRLSFEFLVMNRNNFHISFSKSVVFEKAFNLHSAKDCLKAM